MAPFVLEADSIIAAVGQKPDFQPFTADESIKLNKYGYMEVDPYTLQTSKPGVFVGGDAVSGGGTIIEAINAGKTAAKYIDKYLRGEPVMEDIEDKTKRWPSTWARRKRYPWRPWSTTAHGRDAHGIGGGAHQELRACGTGVRLGPGCRRGDR
jgi:NADH dehydrogenase FAD-containing subunit